MSESLRRATNRTGQIRFRLQTLTLRARWDDTLYYPDLVIWDGCRAIAFAVMGWNLRALQDCYHIGLDATPKWAVSKPLRPFF